MAAALTGLGAGTAEPLNFTGGALLSGGILHLFDSDLN